MGPEFLVDTNIVIAYFNQTIPEKGALFLDNLLPAISVITRIELLGWHQITADEVSNITSFIGDATIYSLTERIVVRTIALRQTHKIKLPDAVIAATAFIHNLTLLTRNTSDFKQIPGLPILNPFEL
jgi:predicted nucleic acid-binding protein